jgi:hypothetical protein
MNLNLKPIDEHSYSWAEGFSVNMPRYESGMRQLDWNAIKTILESKEFDKVEVGLAEDYYQTHAVIFENGELIIRENGGAGFFGASRWATPAVKLTKNGETGLFECWILGRETGFPEWLINSARRVNSWDEE